MSGHEARINEALKQLGEEFRLGMVSAEDYRARRRALLESWGERDVTTSPGSLRALPKALPQTRIQTTMAPAQRARSKLPLALLAAGGLLLVAAGAWFIFAPQQRPPANAPAAVPAAPPLSERVSAVKRAADDFLARNAWEAEPIGAFLAQWRMLTPAERAQAREQPALRTLRFELEQNIQAETQLVPPDAPPDAPPEQRQRLDLLTDFARELDA